MIWAGLFLVLLIALWLGRFWLALGLARPLARLGHGGRHLKARRVARKLTRYSARL